MHEIKTYGVELILDLHNCNATTFTRKSIKGYFKHLCKVIDMKTCKLTWWDDIGVPEEEKQTEPHLKGTSAVQFIMTSSIVIHTLDLMNCAYINIFSCKTFDSLVAQQISEKWFNGNAVTSQVVIRK